MKILLAIKASTPLDAITRAVIRQFRPEGAEICVLHVLELDRVVPPVYDYARGQEYGDDVVARLTSGQAAAKELTAGVAEQLQAAGFRTSSTVIAGEPKTAILACAATWQAELIIVGGQERGHVRLSAGKGKVAAAVALEARCSVQIVRADHFEPLAA
jgi:nucleotide-binding universal stress UspA family protein